MARTNKNNILEAGLIAAGLSMSLLLGPLALKGSADEPNSMSEREVLQPDEKQIEDYKENRDKITMEFIASTKQYYKKVNSWKDDFMQGRIDKEEYYERLVTEYRRLFDAHSKLLLEFDPLIPPSLDLVKRHLSTLKGFKEGIEADRSGTIKDFEAEKRHRSRSFEYFMKCGDDLKREVLYDN